MSLDGIGFSRDPSGVTHETVCVSFPVLGRDNDVDYVDGEVTLCGDYGVGRWTSTAGPAVTCVACLAARFHLDSQSWTYTRELPWNDDQPS